MTRIAGFVGKESYDQITTNVYGSRLPATMFQAPPAQAMTPEEVSYAQEIVGAALEVTDPWRIAAYLYGDELVGQQGHPMVGLPAYAGFEVGYRLVKSYLARTGKSVIDVLLQASEVFV